MSVDTKSLRKLAEAATPGPWAVGPYYNRDGHGVGPVVHDVGHVNSDAVVAEHVVKEDAAFIAAANPQTVIALLDDNESLNETAKRRLDDMALMSEKTVQLREQLSAMTAARDEACRILHDIGSHDDEYGYAVDSAAALRKVGAP